MFSKVKRRVKKTTKGAASIFSQTRTVQSRPASTYQYFTPETNVEISQEMIAVGAGKPLILFALPKSLLCYYSGYFQSILENGRKKLRQEVVILKQTTPEVFSLLVEWILTQKIEKIQTADETLASSNFDNLTELWALADYLAMPKLQNVTLKLIDDLSRGAERIPSENFDYVYNDKNTKPKCALRRYMVDLMVWNVEKVYFHAYMHWYPQEMLMDVAHRFEDKYRGEITGIPTEDVRNYFVGEDIEVPQVEKKSKFRKAFDLLKHSGRKPEARC